MLRVSLFIRISRISGLRFGIPRELKQLSIFLSIILLRVYTTQKSLWLHLTHSDKEGVSASHSEKAASQQIQVEQVHTTDHKQSKRASPIRRNINLNWHGENWNHAATRRFLLTSKPRTNLSGIRRKWDNLDWRTGATSHCWSPRGNDRGRDPTSNLRPPEQLLSQSDQDGLEQRAGERDVVEDIVQRALQNLEYEVEPRAPA